MKKKFRTTILCFCLIFLLFSCDGSLNSFLTKFNSNLYISTGMIKVDTSFETNFATVETNTVTHPDGSVEQTLGSSISVTTAKDNRSGSITIGEAGSNQIEVKIENNDGAEKYISAISNGVTPPMSEDGYKQFTQNLANKPSNTEGGKAYDEHLKAPADEKNEKEAKGTFALTALAAQEAAKNTEDAALQEVLNSVANLATDAMNSEKLSNSDVYKAQLIVSIVTDTTNLNSADETKKADAQAAIINKATTLLQLSKRDAGNFDIAQTIDINGLINSFGGSSNPEEPKPEEGGTTTRAIKAVAEEGNTPSDDSNYLKTVIDNADKLLIDLFGFNKTTGTFNKERFERTLASYNQIEIANRMIITNIPETEISNKYDLTKAVDYALGVIIAQLNTLDRSIRATGMNATLQSLLEVYIDKNRWILEDNPTAKDAVIPQEIKDVAEKLGIELDNDISFNMFVNTTDNAIINENTLLSQAKNVDNVLKTFKMFDGISLEKYITDLLGSKNQSGNN